MNVSKIAPLNVLFLCTHNSARSILAEALLNNLGQGCFKTYSAGSNPRENQKPNPFAIHVLQRVGVSIEGLYSKSWDEFSRTDAPQMDLIITVCDNAAGETCLFWHDHPTTAHWGYPDPSYIGYSEEEKLAVFTQTMLMIRRRLELLVSIPKEKLEYACLQQSARDLSSL